MNNNEAIEKVVEIFQGAKMENLEDITNGENFDKIYSETRKKVTNFLMNKVPVDLKSQLTVTGENFFLFFTSVTMMISVEFSIETDGQSPHRRFLTVVDEIDGNLVDLYIEDYSIVDLVKNEKLSRYSLNMVKDAIRKLYELRGTEEKINRRFLYVDGKLSVTEWEYEEHNIKVDPYKHNVDNEIEDEDALEDSFNKLDEDEIESDLSRRWSTSVFSIFTEFNDNFVVNFRKENAIEIACGKNFDSVYYKFVKAFREIEEKYHPIDKKSKEKPIDIFLYFCDNIINIDVGLVKLNESLTSMKRFCSDYGKALAIDNNDFDRGNGGLFNYNSFMPDELISKIKIVNFMNAETLYNDVKVIYEFRQNF